MGLLINLYGGPGTGKSTTAAGVFTLLKLHGVDCELVTEFAKDLVWEERYRTFENQYYIFGKQHHRIWRLYDKVDVVITDSPLMLSVLYGEINDCVSQEFITWATSITKDFDTWNIMLTRTKAYNPNGRNQTEDEAILVDKLTERMLEKYNMDYIKASGDKHGINFITKKILKNSNIDLEFKIY
jgi:tRNA uridine 5-carbamoylmethylation protein Kti12